MNRRDFVTRGSALLASGLSTAALGRRRAWAQQPPAVVTSDRARPTMPYGVQSGDVMADRAIVWSRTDRPARMMVEWATNEAFRDARRVIGPAALADSDFTARIDLVGLPSGADVFYRVSFVDLTEPRVSSAPLTGRVRTAPSGRRTVRFCWSGDEAGQGWGINREWGGMKLYETMRRTTPDFFIHSGDQIYADGPIVAEVKLDDGATWKNVTTEAKAKVAETLAEFRGNFAYNFLDEHKRRFTAEVPVLVQWDDHETRNNWYPGQTLGDARYQVRSASLLAAYAKRAMFEYNPFRLDPVDPERVYRAFPYGPSLEVFMLDERSYRGPNSENRQPSPGPETAFLGPAQLAWLKQAIVSSAATWKLLVSDMPLSLIVPDGRKHGVLMQEAWANGRGPPLGRELELAELLHFAKRRGVKNIVVVTADVHYAAAHYYDPQQADHADFDPFWEFVAGPLHASTYGPDTLDPTFGPQVKYQSPPSGKRRRSPADGGQYFGVLRVDAKTEVLTVSLHDLHGDRLYTVDLPPRR